MRYGITGASGLVGTALQKHLAASGHEVVRLPRILADPASLESLDAVVHLAGASIGEGRWTEERKRLIQQSRVETTQALVARLAECRRPPGVLISASAIGYYGNRGNEELTESSAPGQGFLAAVCRQWEAEAQKASRDGLRVVLVRSGVVLSPRGGALPRMIQPFEWFVGGPLGQGQQWMSWIHVDDEVAAVTFSAENPALEGPVNLTAPNPVTNLEFARQLGRLLGRPAALRTPAFTLRTAMGREMADELLLTSHRVLPEKLEASGFRFRFPNLAEALADLLAKRGQK